MKTLKMVWIYSWAYVFIIAGLIGRALDYIGDTINRLLDKDWFAGLVVIANVYAVLHMVMR